MCQSISVETFPRDFQHVDFLGSFYFNFFVIKLKLCFSFWHIASCPLIYIEMLEANFEISAAYYIYLN